MECVQYSFLPHSFKKRTKSVQCHCVTKWEKMKDSDLVNNFDNGAKFPISNFSVNQTDFHYFLPVCNGMAWRRCAAPMHGARRAGNICTELPTGQCRLKAGRQKSKSQIANWRGTLRLPWRRVPRQVGEPCLRFFFFCSESSRISRARSPSRVSRLRHNEPKIENPILKYLFCIPFGLKVSLFQNVFWVSYFRPKYQRKFLIISALESKKQSNQQNQGTFL